jgi:hypothetical protein
MPFQHSAENKQFPWNNEVWKNEFVDHFKVSGQA